MATDQSVTMNHSRQPRLRIAQLAPLYEPIPPRLYGGTERVVSYITEELVRRGHEVTLFASGDSKTKAKLSPGCEQALRLTGNPEIGTYIQLPMISDAYENAAERFDIIHSHIDYWSFPCGSSRIGAGGSRRLIRRPPFGVVAQDRQSLLNVGADYDVLASSVRLSARFRTLAE